MLVTPGEIREDREAHAVAIAVAQGAHRIHEGGDQE
jgi:hypothetical protein